MRVGGVWVPNSRAPLRILPSSIMSQTTTTPSESRFAHPGVVRQTPALIPTSGTTSDTPGFLSHVSPWMGIAGLLIVGAMRLHPATAGAALFIGVGISVINYGSEPAGPLPGSSNNDPGARSGPGWLNPHF